MPYNPKQRELEPEIKAATLSRLMSDGCLSRGQTVINEFTIDGYSRRVDLVIATDKHLIAIEVKSEADSLYRLAGQTEKYLEYFDKVIVVTAPKHLAKILETVPKHVAVWEISNGNIKIRQRGKIIPVKDKTKLLRLMKANELIKLTHKLDLCIQSKNRRSAECALTNAPLSEIKRNLIESLKNRFILSCSHFWSDVRTSKVSAKHIDLLSPYKKERQSQKSSERETALFWSTFRSIGNEDTNFKEISKNTKGRVFGKTPSYIRRLLAA